MKQDQTYLARDDLQSLLDALKADGFRCVGPQVRDGIIRYAGLEQASQLPWGVTESQAPGEYRLHETDNSRCFAWANGPQALKPIVFAPRENLWQSTQAADGSLGFSDGLPDVAPLAVIGVRPCDIAALYLHDQHFLQQEYRDPYYLQRRQDLLPVAVNCTHPAATCFCASTGDGPRASYGFDIALTELEEGYLVEVHSEQGRAICAQLPLQPATHAHLQTVEDAMQQAADSQVRQLPADNLKAPLFANLEHPRWEEIAGRCLSCGNCTAVCPTCFCHSEADEVSLDGLHTEHYRQWDSCFTQGHSYIHGLTVRPQTAQRYRQWLTHKLGSWHDQYGRSGCIGCGRCITWCPVGIDLTEEATVICSGSLPS